MSESLPQNNFPVPVLAEPFIIKPYAGGEARESTNKSVADASQLRRATDSRGGENNCLDDGYTEFGFRHEPL